MYKIPSLDDLFKHLMPQGCDDPRVQQQLLLSEEYTQICPETVYGGRQVLWWCFRCQHCWWQIDTLLYVLHLTPSQAIQIGYRLHAAVQPDGTILGLPQRLCPACLGAVLVLGTFPGSRLSCHLLWHPLPPSSTHAASTTPRHDEGGAVLTHTPPHALAKGMAIPSFANAPQTTAFFAMMEDTDGIIRDGVREGATARPLAALGDTMLSLLPDLPSELDALPIQLRWASQVLLPPRQQECIELTPSHLGRLHRLIQPAPGKTWKGYLWSPTDVFKPILTPRPLVFCSAVIEEEEESVSPVALHLLWQRLIPSVFAATRWDELLS